MLVGVLSDTHDRLPKIHEALKLFSERRVEAIVHPGDFVAPFAVRPLLEFDGPVHATFGNNDGERAGLSELMPQIADGPLWVTLGGRKVLIHHFLGWCAPKDVQRADIVITGHTHVVLNEEVEGRLHLNPGECCGWVNGVCTVAVLDTQTCRAEICELNG
ncbi:MAG: metallophosphoesterase [Phycisphaerae bacterium]